MADNDDLVYHFAGITDIADAIARFNKDMQGNLDEVDTTFKNLLADGWQGMGANEFDGVSKKIHAAANDLANTLMQLSQKVGNAAFEFQAADQRAANRIMQAG